MPLTHGKFRAAARTSHPFCHEILPAVIADLLRARHPNATTVDVDEAVVAFLSGLGLPKSIVQSLTQVSYCDWLGIENHSIVPANDLPGLNTEDLYSPWFNRRYLTIGGGLNGDPIAIDLDSMLMCFIFHDEMYPRDEYLPDDFVLHTPLNHSDFWNAVETDPSFPVDAYDAEDRWGRRERFPKTRKDNDMH